MNKNPITYNIANNMLFAQAEGVILFEDIVEHYQLLFIKLKRLAQKTNLFNSKFTQFTIQLR